MWAAGCAVAGCTVGVCAIAECFRGTVMWMGPGGVPIMPQCSSALGRLRMGMWRPRSYAPRSPSSVDAAICCSPRSRRAGPTTRSRSRPDAGRDARGAAEPRAAEPAALCASRSAWNSMLSIGRKCHGRRPTHTGDLGNRRGLRWMGCAYGAVGALQSPGTLVTAPLRRNRVTSRRSAAFDCRRSAAGSGGPSRTARTAAPAVLHHTVDLDRGPRGPRCAGCRWPR